MTDAPNTDPSLAANRDGRLSDAQRARVRGQMRAYTRSRGAVMSMLPIIGLLVTGPIAYANHTWVPLVVAAGMMALLVPVALLLWWRLSDVYADLGAGRVESVTGTEAGRFVNSRTGEAYLRVGNVRMQTFGAGSDPSWRLKALIGGVHDINGVMRVYYLPRSKLLIAAEPPGE